MKGYVKDFLLRGLLFGGFGPLITGVVYLCLSYSLEHFSLSGGEVCLAIFSTYVLAFVHAGASVFHQIERWPLAKSLGLHFLVLYLAYSLCYLINAWIPFEPVVLLIFTAVFVGAYFLIWGIVYLCIRHTSRRFNEKLQE